MQRFSISLDDGLAAQFDAFIAAQGYESRFEAVRDLTRARGQPAGALVRGHRELCVRPP